METVIYKMVSNTGHEIAVVADPEMDHVFVRIKLDLGHGGDDYETSATFVLSGNGVAMAIQHAASIVSNWATCDTDEFANMIDAAADGHGV